MIGRWHGGKPKISILNEHQPTKLMQYVACRFIYPAWHAAKNLPIRQADKHPTCWSCINCNALLARNDCIVGSSQESQVLCELGGVVVNLIKRHEM